MIKANRSFIFDAAANLIQLQAGRFPDALIPHAVKVATPANELAHPFPWTLTHEAAVAEITSLPYAMVEGTIAEHAFKNKRIPHTPYVFVPPANVLVDDDEVYALLDVYEALDSMDVNRKLIETELASAGIEKLPVLSHCHPETHVCAAVHRITAHSQAGWLSHSKVYRKAIPILVSSVA